MRILVLGGTRFVGRHIVNACLTRGHDITLLHRGHTRSPFLGAARHVLTDRRTPTAEASTVLAEAWDAVIDTSASRMEDVRAITRLLRNPGHYVFVSTCGVYSRQQPGTITEQSPTIASRPADPRHASASRKLHCERLLSHHCQRTGVPLAILRLGLVVGPHDYSDRLAYWLQRARRGDDMLVPMQPDQPIQIVDAADIARLARTVLERQLAGVINVPGPSTSARDLLNTILDATGHAATPCWVDEDFALRHGLRPWSQVPLWLPVNSPERALMNVSSERAARHGLRYTPLADTVTACQAAPAAPRTSAPRWLEPAREHHLLHQWRTVARR